MLKQRLKKTAVFVCAAMLALGTFGAGNTAFGAPSYKELGSREEIKGQLLVSAGPDISILYDRNGTVVKIEGIDEDGKKFLEGQDGYAGESCQEAMGTLIVRLEEKGWFGDNRDTARKSLIVKALRGSEYPDDEFLKNIEDKIRDAANKQNINAYIKVIGAQALDDKGYIGKETAEKIVLEYFGLNADSLKIKEYELDDGVYEVEVVIQGIEHEVELNAVTGEVLDVNRDDDHDGYYDDDDRYDDQDDNNLYDDDRGENNLHDDDRDDDDDDRDDDDRDDDGDRD